MVGSDCVYESRINNQSIDDRFSIDNLFRKVSFENFKQTAQELESSLKEIRPNLTGKLLLTTNGGDYYRFGNLAIITPETEAASKRREQYELSELNKKLWGKSFKKELYFNDGSLKEPYLVSLSTENKDSKKLFFYGQCLDNESYQVLKSFKKTRLFQKMGDGYPKKSDFPVESLVSLLK